MDLVKEYLAASGATAICIMRDVRGRYDFRVGRNGADLPDAVNVQWIDRGVAAAVARQARGHIVGRRGLLASDLALELHRAAASHGQRLTPHLVAVSRATFGAKKVEEMLKVLKDSGAMHALNAEYKRRRKESTGKFPKYPVVESRLRRVIIEALVARKSVGDVALLFDELFR